ncbi:P-II family nitrogen regulator [Brassicibacter mesophilus]|uniref:P-II family nitrogen regulator n=1 Tax=Brassicibacter mesophilus TaxID=745119 RepID=UPI003D24663A
MKYSPDTTECELICIIVKFGLASKIMKHAREYGVTGGTILLGKGTIKSPILEILGLNEVRREIIIMAAGKAVAYSALEELNKKFRFEKPHNGIAFSTSLLNILGAHNLTCKDIKEKRGVKNLMYNLIFTVVDRGKAEFVVEAANRAGSRGATIINARGSGIHETSKLFSMEIEPEKEVVLILSQSDLTEQIASSIREQLSIDEPGNGIIFIQEINKTYGLY